MYEHMRNDFLSAAHDAEIAADALASAVRILDQVASRYEIAPRELSLAVYNDGLPEVAKIYLVCKKIEGLSDRTLETYMRVLRLFFQAVQKPLERITANDIRVYLFQYQQARRCSNRSLDKYRNNIAGFFTWATDEGYLTSNPMRTIPAIKYERKPRENLTQIELEYLRAACRTPREKAIIEFLYSTGCRVSELSNVKKSDVDWNAKSVHLVGKGNKHRTSYINAKSAVTLEAYLATREDQCEFLFVTDRKPYRGLTTAAVEKIVRKIAARTTQIQRHVTPHVLRHTTATMALKSGMPIADISKLLGHEKVDTTMIYAHVSTEDVQTGHRRHVV